MSWNCTRNTPTGSCYGQLTASGGCHPCDGQASGNGGTSRITGGEVRKYVCDGSLECSGRLCHSTADSSCGSGCSCVRANTRATIGGNDARFVDRAGMPISLPSNKFMISQSLLPRARTRKRKSYRQ